MGRASSIPPLHRIDEMQSGWELDRLVATLVMHWHYFEYPPGRCGPLRWGEWIDRTGQCQTGGYDGGFHPSSNARDADRVMSSFGRGWSVSIERDRVLMWKAVISLWVPEKRKSTYEEASALSWPLAVCRASLKVRRHPEDRQ